MDLAGRGPRPRRARSTACPTRRSARPARPAAGGLAQHGAGAARRDEQRGEVDRRAPRRRRARRQHDRGHLGRARSPTRDARRRAGQVEGAAAAAAPPTSAERGDLARAASSACRRARPGRGRRGRPGTATSQRRLSWCQRRGQHASVAATATTRADGGERPTPRPPTAAARRRRPRPRRAHDTTVAREVAERRPQREAALVAVRRRLHVDAPGVGRRRRARPPRPPGRPARARSTAGGAGDRRDARRRRRRPARSPAPRVSVDEPGHGEGERAGGPADPRADRGHEPAPASLRPRWRRRRRARRRRRRPATPRRAAHSVTCAPIEATARGRARRDVAGTARRFVDGRAPAGERVADVARDPSRATWRGVERATSTSVTRGVGAGKESR